MVVGGGDLEKVGVLPLAVCNNVSSFLSSFLRGSGFGTNRWFILGASSPDVDVRRRLPFPEIDRSGEIHSGIQYKQDGRL